MTYQSISESSDTLKLRYFPLATWVFIVLALYGMGTIIAAIMAGRQPLNGGLLALAMLGGFTIFVTIVGAAINSVDFDRRTNTVRLRRYGLLGRSITERRLDEVNGLQVRLLRRSQHRIELRMRSGEVLPLTSSYVVTFSNGGINRLCAYLGLEPELVSGQSDRPARSG